MNSALTTAMTSALSSALKAEESHIVCHIFCRVIDNYGDMGVCWRLARQLRSEHGLQVTLWLDDWRALPDLLPAPLSDSLPRDFPAQDSLPLAEQPTVRNSSATDGFELLPGLRVCKWQQPLPDIAELPLVDIVIEAFACELPAEYQAWLTQQAKPPLWINLEYLSAEHWVGQCHGLSSAHPQTGMQKTFFFPGFTPATGGLIRENDLLVRHDHWQAQQTDTRKKVLTALGVSEADIRRLQTSTESLLISVFTYETAALSAWLQLLATGSAAVLCLIPLGRTLQDIDLDLINVGDRRQLGNLTVQVVPFQCQDDYDQLLSVCDLNLVRGEDSFVRAQWAAKPALWHIYQQQDAAHLQKLLAFLDLYTSDLDDEQAQAVRKFWLDWNNGADCSASWPAFLAQLPDLRVNAHGWREKLLLHGDIASNLMKFYENTL